MFIYCTINVKIMRMSEAPRYWFAACAQDGSDSINS